MQSYTVEWVTDGDAWRPAMRGRARIVSESKEKMVDRLAKILVQRGHVDPNRLGDIHYRIDETLP